MKLTGAAILILRGINFCRGPWQLILSVMRLNYGAQFGYIVWR